MTVAQDLFDEFNRKYFRDRLPRYRVRFVGARHSGWRGDCDPKRRMIRLAGDRSFVDPRTLLHEMCHIGTPDHGKRFQAKLLRLAAQGVEWAREEAEGYATAFTWNEEQSNVRGKLNEIAQTLKPRPTFREMIRWLATSYGVDPVRMPWLRAAWRNACREADMYEGEKVARLRHVNARYRRERERGRSP